jgi:Flp pilus assembly pilin Flp
VTSNTALFRVTARALVRWRTRARQEGQGLVEYGLILFLVAVVCVVSLLFFGDQLSSLLSLIASAV